MYKYLIITFNGTVGKDSNTEKIFYAGERSEVSSKFAIDIYKATLFDTAAEATAVMDVLIKKHKTYYFSIGMAEIALVLI